MEAKDAAALARNRILELFEPDGAKNIGLEEIEFDEEESIWKVTIGFSRPWNREEQPPLASIVEALSKPRLLTRDMKVVAIRDSDSQVLSVRNRE